MTQVSMDELEREGSHPGNPAEASRLMAAGRSTHPWTGSATFSECLQFRYALTRNWDDARPPLISIGLNPSKADGSTNDPTISNEIALARQWGFGGLRKANLFAFRATNPRDMWAADDPVGPENDDYLMRLASLGSGIVFCCWGSGAATGRQRGLLLERENYVYSMLEPRFELMCIGQTKAGHPWHPLMKSHSLPLHRWAR